MISSTFIQPDFYFLSVSSLDIGFLKGWWQEQWSVVLGWLYSPLPAFPLMRQTDHTSWAGAPARDLLYVPISVEDLSWPTFGILPSSLGSAASPLLSHFLLSAFSTYISADRETHLSPSMLSWVLLPCSSQGCGEQRHRQLGSDRDSYDGGGGGKFPLPWACFWDGRKHQGQGRETYLMLILLSQASPWTA